VKRTMAAALLIATATIGSPRAAARAQTSTKVTTTTTTTTTTKTLAESIKVYVFPQKGQTSTQQAVDEAQCYSWAVKETGNDPFQLQKKAEVLEQRQAAASQQAAAPPAGYGGAGAVKGAAAGALFGAIGGSAGTGAAIGAATGFIGGRIRARQQQAAAAEHSEKTAAKQQATQGQIDEFKRAFGACLEGKNYIVK